MPNVFISYRRADSASTAGRIYDQLVARFGRETVFKDVDSIPPGVDFAGYIEDAIRRSAVALIIIGPRWLNASGGWRRRLDNPGDFVRIEIETALRLGVAVVPLLVDGAAMPAAARLPASLRPLTQRNALPVRPDPDFHRDMERVLVAVERALTAPPVALRATPPVTAPVTPQTAPPISPPVMPPGAPSHIQPEAGRKSTAASQPVTPPPDPSQRWRVESAPTAHMAAPGAERSASPPPVLPTQISPRPAPRTPALSDRPPRRPVARGALYLAVALLIVAALAIAPFTLPRLFARVAPLTAAQQTDTAATKTASAEYTALASVTPILYQTPTPTATPVTVPITLGYSSSKPGCDSRYWNPMGAAPHCSGSGMTLTHASADKSVTATVSGVGSAYTVEVTISNIHGAVWGVITLNNLGVELAPSPSQTQCNVGEPAFNPGYNGIGANIPTYSSNHFRITVGASSGRSGDVTVTVNGNNCWYPNESGAPPYFAPGALKKITLSLYDQYDGANPSSSDAVTFSNLKLYAA